MMINPRYRRLLRKQPKQIVVLLGAGAARGLWSGTSSEELKEKFIQDTTYKTLDETKTIGKYLFEKLDTLYTDGSANFETFLAALEAILNYVISETNEGGINISNTSFTSVIFDLKQEIKSLLENSDDKRIFCGELFRHYVNLVINSVNEYNDGVLKHEENNANLVQFIKYFQNRKYSIKFYTTNYDNAIPQILKNKIYEGFHTTHNDSTTTHKEFDLNLNKFRIARLSHFNIHGSIFLKKEFSNSSYRYTTIYKDYAQLLTNALSEEGGNPNEKLTFSPIITGYNKTQRIVNEPFNLGFHAFANDLNDCMGLLTVGYSFSDPHINSLLSSFTSWGKTKFIHVTFCNNEETELINFRRERCQLERVVNKFIKEESDETWLHDRSGRKYVYKKGFDSFLKDSSNWKYLLPRY
jgi:hypothetical protein